MIYGWPSHSTSTWNWTNYSPSSHRCYGQINPFINAGDASHSALYQAHTRLMFYWSSCCELVWVGPASLKPIRYGKLGMFSQAGCSSSRPTSSIKTLLWKYHLWNSDSSFQQFIAILISGESADVKTALCRRFPDNHSPGQTFPGQDLFRTITFPDRRFPDKLY